MFHRIRSNFNFSLPRTILNYLNHSPIRKTLPRYSSLPNRNFSTSKNTSELNTDFNSILNKIQELRKKNKYQGDIPNTYWYKNENKLSKTSIQKKNNQLLEITDYLSKNDISKNFINLCENLSEDEDKVFSLLFLSRMTTVIPPFRTGLNKKKMEIIENMDKFKQDMIVLKQLFEIYNIIRLENPYENKMNSFDKTTINLYFKNLELSNELIEKNLDFLHRVKKKFTNKNPSENPLEAFKFLKDNCFSMYINYFNQFTKLSSFENSSPKTQKYVLSHIEEEKEFFQKIYNDLNDFKNAFHSIFDQNF